MDGRLAADYMHIVGRCLHIIKVKAICRVHGQFDSIIIRYLIAIRSDNIERCARIFLVS